MSNLDIVFMDKLNLEKSTCFDIKKPAYKLLWWKYNFQCHC